MESTAVNGESAEGGRRAWGKVALLISHLVDNEESEQLDARDRHYLLRIGDQAHLIAGEDTFGELLAEVNLNDLLYAASATRAGLDQAAA